MSMRAMGLDDPKLTELRQKHMDAMSANDTQAYMDTLDALMAYHGEQLSKEYELLQSEMDDKVRASRGEWVQTSKEKTYFEKLGNAMKAKDVKSALANLDVVMPQTVFDNVFEELRTRHPLLSKIRFQNTNGAIKFLMNLNGYQRAAWGPLCAEIVKELSSGFKEVDATLIKLSAFIPVCKAMLDLGPQWLDRYVREILLEALANGLEWGIVNGSGKDEPIGMIRQVGDEVSITGGVHPEKTPIKISDFSPATMGNMVSILAANPNGQARTVDDLILLVNPQDYFQKIMPATTILGPSGTYQNNIFAYPTQVIQSAALPRGKAVFGIARLYLAFSGMARDGRIEYSDEYRFLEDERVYLIKTYANGMAADNNAFLVLDIAGLKPATYKVTVETPSEPSAEAGLSDLKLGSLVLSPSFSPSVTSYTATTSNATNTINAVPAEASAAIQVLVNDEEMDNGSAATWKSGSNTVTVNVTAADGQTQKAYTVTVTKGQTV